MTTALGICCLIQGALRLVWMPKRVSETCQADDAFVNAMIVLIVTAIHLSIVAAGVVLMGWWTP